MEPSVLLSFLAFAAVIVLVPGPDFAVVVKNALSCGQRGGQFAAAGIGCSNLVHGSCAALGISVLIAQSQPVFTAIRWLGIAYLTFLGIQALMSAWRGRYPPQAAREAAGGRAWLQGFLSNITNPKVLAFYLSVLPVFMADNGSITSLLALAYSHAVLSIVWLSMVALTAHGVRRWLSRRRLRRSLDAVTGAALLGFGARLAVE